MDQEPDPAGEQSMRIHADQDPKNTVCSYFRQPFVNQSIIEGFQLSDLEFWQAM
jgi:hypothetical protein